MLYRTRMWLDEAFGDFKKHSFDLESTRLLHIFRLSRLTLAVVLLYFWLVTSEGNLLESMIILCEQVAQLASLRFRRVVLAGILLGLAPILVHGTDDPLYVVGRCSTSPLTS